MPPLLDEDLELDPLLEELDLELPELDLYELVPLLLDEDLVLDDLVLPELLTGDVGL